MAEIDPRKNTEAAANWLKQFVEWMAESEIEMGKWREVIVQLVGVGIISCDEVRRYNQRAQALFFFQSRFLEKFQPLRNILLSRNIFLPEEPPLPQLIGINYQTGGKGTQRSFQISVPCVPTSDGEILDKSRLTQIFPSPTCPQQGLTGTALCVAGPWAAIGCAVMGGILAIGGYFAVAAIDSVKGVINSLTGAEITSINRAMLEVEGKRDAQRADFILKCVRSQLAQIKGPTTADQQAKIWKGCETGSLKAFPTRKIPVGSMFASIALIGGGLLATYFVAKLITRRRESAIR